MEEKYTFDCEKPIRPIKRKALPPSLPKNAAKKKQE